MTTTVTPPARRRPATKTPRTQPKLANHNTTNHNAAGKAQVRGASTGVTAARTGTTTGTAPTRPTLRQPGYAEVIAPLNPAPPAPSRSAPSQSAPSQSALSQSAPPSPTPMPLTPVTLTPVTPDQRSVDRSTGFDITAAPRAVLRESIRLLYSVLGEERLGTAQANAWASVCADRERARRRAEAARLIAAARMNRLP